MSKIRNCLPSKKLKTIKKHILRPNPYTHLLFKFSFLQYIRMEIASSLKYGDIEIWRYALIWRGKITKLLVKFSIEISHTDNGLVGTITHWSKLVVFHNGGPYHIETSPLICRANQWTGFCF